MKLRATLEIRSESILPSIWLPMGFQSFRPSRSVRTVPLQRAAAGQRRHDVERLVDVDRRLLGGRIVGNGHVGPLAHRHRQGPVQRRQPLVLTMNSGLTFLPTINR